MKRLALALLALATLAAAAPEEARWIRYPALSPDGTRIAFCYRGDLWIVPSDGGDAWPLTTHVGHETAPVWSPDGTKVAFASDRHGNFDLFVVDSDGGAATRLTAHSSTDWPCCFSRDGKEILFTSRRQDAPEACLPTAWLTELYAVPVGGGPARQVLTTPAEMAQWSPDGRLLAYHDSKGFENVWRKHHESSVTRDLWIWDPATDRHRRVTEYAGEDRNPVWSANGERLFFLSERGNGSNVWSQSVAGGDAPVQLTRFPRHPVRFLSGASDGTLLFGHNGRVYRMRPGEEPQALVIRARATDRTNDARIEKVTEGATAFAVSPTGEEVAFVVRGELFCASIEHGTTRRLTNTPEQERSPTWAPDGRSIVFAGERGGSWNLYRVSIARPEEKRLSRATLLAEETLLAGGGEAFQPLLSPDGRRIAYLHNRDEIRLLDLETRQGRTLVPAARNYSYADGDIEFQWSPDSRWLCFTLLVEGRWLGDIGVAPADGGAITDVTLSGYDEMRPRFSPDGKALLFVSNRLGRRSHGSWGTEDDIFALYLTQAAFDRASLTQEEYELLKKDEDEAKEGDGCGKGEEEAQGKPKEEPKEKPKEKPPEPVVIEFEGRENRLKRLTLHSAPLGGYALSPDGESLVYWAEVAGKWDVWIHTVRKSEARKLFESGAEGPGEVEWLKGGEGEHVLVRASDGAITRVPVGEGESKPVPYAAEMTVDGPKERAYIFEHCWRQVRDKFYEPTLHGVDWNAMKANYEAFLPHLSNNHEFAELLSEMLGELNASHTGSGYRLAREDGDATASLGLLFDPRFAGPGLRVAEVLKEGPADRAEVALPAGSVVLEIDGVTLPQASDPWALLNRKEGRPTLLTVRAPGEEKVRQVSIKPVSMREEFRLREKRWMLQRRDLADRLSKGRIGYVYVEGMDDASFRHLFQEALGRFGAREALLVDTRFNGGGWLHDDLLKFLGGKGYGVIHPRGKDRGALGHEPIQRWSKPVCVLMSEGNYSDAHIFPYAFQKLGLGKLVGAPVAGTGTAVWWETQIDETLYFGIPQVGFVTDDGKYLENRELRPDVLVLAEPGDLAAGRDAQLERAVALLLEELGPK